MRRLVFVGPSWPHAASALDRFGVEVFHPIVSGDLFAANLREGDRIGIVDGMFRQQPAIRHKEILTFLSRGIRIFGSSSMGALRAAELAPFGMTGVGGVYERFLAGQLDADDEVALAHADAEDHFLHLSEPLVNLTATIEQVVALNKMSSQEARAAIRILKKASYWDRGWHLLLKGALAGASKTRRLEIVQLCRSNYRDIKEEDARLLARHLLGDDAPPLPQWTLSYTTFVKRLERSALERNERNPETAAVALRQLIDPSIPNTYQDLSLKLIAQDCSARCGRQLVFDEETSAMEHGVHVGLYADAVIGPDTAVLETWLTEFERSSSWLESCAIFFARSFRFEPGVSAATELCNILRSDKTSLTLYVDLVRFADKANQDATKRLPRFDAQFIAMENLKDFLIQLWVAPDRHTAELYAMSRGYPSLVAAANALRRWYVLLKYSRPLVDTALSNQGASHSGDDADA